MLGKIEGKMRRGQQRMRWLDGVTDWMDMSLSKLIHICMHLKYSWTHIFCNVYFLHGTVSQRSSRAFYFSTNRKCKYIVLLLYCLWLLRRSVVSSPLTHPPGFFVWDFPGKNTSVGCHFLLQEIFLTRGSYLHLLFLLDWQVDSLPLSLLGSLCSDQKVQIIEWVECALFKYSLDQLWSCLWCGEHTCSLYIYAVQ